MVICIRDQIVSLLQTNLRGLFCLHGPVPFSVRIRIFYNLLSYKQVVSAFGEISTKFNSNSLTNPKLSDRTPTSTLSPTNLLLEQVFFIDIVGILFSF
jgi:hypothetical protein